MNQIKETKGKALLFADAVINLFLGIVLLAYSQPVVDFFGLPQTQMRFYPNILGAVLFGIGIALLIEFVRRGSFVGLGLGGAIVINLTGGIALFIWLISGRLSIPAHGLVVLWVLDGILIGISLFELFVHMNSRKKSRI